MAVEAAHVGEQVQSHPLALDVDELHGTDSSQRGGGLAGGELARQATGDEQAHQCVQAADDPGALRDQVVMAVSEQAQHGAVIDRSDDPQPAMAQRDHCRRAGVMRVGLVGSSGIEQPDPRRQGRRDVEHPLTSRDELLGEQRAKPASGFDRPRARAERRREAQQAVGLAAAGVDTQLTNDLLAIVDDGGGVGTLVRVDPDDEHDALLMAVRCGGATAGRPDERVVAPASFEPRRSKNPVGGRFVRKPTKPAAGLETARQALGRYEQPVAPAEHSPSGQSVRAWRGP